MVHDDLSAFGAARFSEADVLPESGHSDLLRNDRSQRTGSLSQDASVRQARKVEKSQSLSLDAARCCIAKKC